MYVRNIRGFKLSTLCPKFKAFDECSQVSSRWVWRVRSCVYKHKHLKLSPWLHTSLQVPPWNSISSWGSPKMRYWSGQKEDAAFDFRYPIFGQTRFCMSGGSSAAKQSCEAELPTRRRSFEKVITFFTEFGCVTLVWFFRCSAFQRLETRGCQ